MESSGYETKTFKDAKAFEDWLETNHQSADGIWIKIAKKASGIPSVTYPEAVDISLCYGWIDGQMKSLDSTYYIQKFTPRRARSAWSLINTKKVAALIEQGRMRPAGQAQIDAAKADGRWDKAYHSSSTFTMPADFLAELEKHPKAKAFYASLTKSQTYGMFYQLDSAKRPETKKARMDKFIEKLNNEEKPTTF